MKATSSTSKAFCDESGYALYDRDYRQDRIKVWRRADRKLVTSQPAG